MQPAQLPRPPATGAYSPFVAVDGWVFVSGQGPLDPGTGAPVLGSIEEQVRLTLRNVAAVLESAGCSLADVVKCTCHLRDIDDFKRFDRAYAEAFGATRPARITVQSVLCDGIGVEIDAIARRRERP
jgi:2-iminobutanoate/2-iminopropanoate deaminase